MAEDLQCHSAGEAVPEGPMSKSLAGVRETRLGGGRVSDSGYRVPDGGWRVTDGGWRVTDGGWR